MQGAVSSADEDKSYSALFGVQERKQEVDGTNRI